MMILGELATADDQRAYRRGPMRPRRLVSVRANQSKRLSSHVFRTVDLTVLALVTVVVAALHSPDAVLSMPLRQIVPLLVGVLILARALRTLSLYRFCRSETMTVHLVVLIGALAIAGGSALLVEAVVGHGQELAQCWWWILASGLAVTILHVGWWLRVRTWRDAGWLLPNLVIVGATDHAERLITEALERRHVNVLGVFDDRRERSPAAVHGVPVLGDVSALLSHRVLPFVDRIVIAVEPSATSRVREISARLAPLPNQVTLFLALDESYGRSAALSELEDSPLAELHTSVGLDRKSFAKRLQDLAIAVPVLVLISPVLAMIALLVKLDSPGPVFFRQRRHGFNNEEILVWKFRSMRTETTDARAERQVSANDERVTRVGRLLRRTSLDELPQLVNVLRGEMSLVGPRPHAIGMKTGEVESARLVAEYAHRHRIKPGMTGWAAVKGSRGPLNDAVEVQRRVALDIDYIARQSFLLDLRIMAMTLPGLLGDRHTVR
ncbi:exopolysaccharide biosynthesis polyprenyl glycosylphosphotransferase [Jatrophihabitans telluris]|uniref:Exopolysaccharide biosynthesis polyprenyl glycosylphosphotransferase n=1 Tax=Jatrophihabitans telluris TaxID=2038343 RepID=A0ABY4R327_9ACTN|nr:exopolysaccharide biosynthesis polyprenyl glycosylphosphotransferase [Jatrophihabitans telluris]UQX89818.1 exopolysaccharide biosynthesis polyprenyl glycosylphosphotransferase [Jatrophihabitans telluris]